MSRLLALASLRYLSRHPWQLLLSLVGVALGVAVVVAVDLASGSALDAFALATDTVTGRATHQIEGGPGGLDEGVYRRLRVELGLRETAPVIEGRVVVPAAGGRETTLLGLDLLAEAPFRRWTPRAGQGLDLQRLLVDGGVLLEPSVAAALSLDVGDALEVVSGGLRRRLPVAGFLEAGAGAPREVLTRLLVVDVATAQELNGSPGRLSRIDLRLPLDDPGIAAQRITALLPPGATLQRAAARGETSEEMTRAFRLNLRALGLLALLCGAFLIYNTITFSVVRRRALIGRLRAVGVTAGQIFRQVLGEALALGLVGSLLGALLGVWLARTLLALVATTVSDLWYAVEVTQVTLSPTSLAGGILLGTGAALLAALPPAREATTTPPRAVLNRSELEETSRRAVPALAAGGVGAAALGGLLLALAPSSVAWSFLSLFAILLGCALVTPLATAGLARLFEPPLQVTGGYLGRMAARNIRAHQSRTGVAMAALVMAVAVTAGIGLMVASFRSTVTTWLAQALPADLYLSGYTTPGARGAVHAGIPGELVARLTALPEVGRLNTLRSVRLRDAGGAMTVVALDLDERSQGAFRFKEGDPEGFWADFHSGRSVLVSEPLAWRRGLSPGDTLTLHSLAGPRTFHVGGIHYDYASDQGALLIDRSTYVALWDDPTIDAVSLFAAPGTTAAGLAAAVDRLVGSGTGLTLRSNRAVREESLRIFDRTFRITGVLRLVASIVAFVGVLSALLALALERSRELALLRASGVTRGQIWRLVTTETGLMGLAAGLLAVPLGLLMAGLMIYVVNRRSFGWTMPLEISPAILGQTVLLALLAALAAGIYPAWRMARAAIADGLREE